MTLSNNAVVDAWAEGRIASNRSMSTDGVILRSYSLEIGRRCGGTYVDGRVIGGELVVFNYTSYMAYRRVQGTGLLYGRPYIPVLQVPPIGGVSQTTTSHVKEAARVGRFYDTDRRINRRKR